MVTTGGEEDRAMGAIFRIKFLLANYQETKLVKANIIIDTSFYQGEKRGSSLAVFLNKYLCWTYVEIPVTYACFIAYFTLLFFSHVRAI